MSFGAHYFKIAMLLRESLLLNGIITNCSSWYGLTETDLTGLESLDLAFFRTLFQVPQTVPTVSLFLETGSYSIRTIIKVRRVIYLHYLLKLKNGEMLNKFFYAQWENPVKADWTVEVKKNLIEFGLTTDLGQIKAFSENKFKNLVKKHAKSYEFERFLEQKETNAKSKMKNLFYNELKMQDYLLLKNMNASQAKALFKFRVRMAPFGENFRGGQAMVICPLCKGHPDGQSESFECVQIKKVIDVQGSYMQIFGQNFSRELVKTVQSIYNFREEYRKLG